MALARPTTRFSGPASAGRWLAEGLELPGVLAYGQSQEGAVSKVQARALRVIAEGLEHGEASVLDGCWQPS